MPQQPAKQRKQSDAAGAAGDGAQAGGGDVPSRDNLILLANARRVAGFSGDWPAELSPAKIAYLQYEKPDWADGEIQTLAKLIDAACRDCALTISTCWKASWDGSRLGIKASSVQNATEMVPLDCAPMKDGSPSQYFSITPDDLAAWWSTLKTSPSKLLAAWMQVPYSASESSTPKPLATPKEWTEGVRRVAWDVSLSLEKITAAGLEIAFAADSRIDWDEKHQKFFLKQRAGLADRQCEVSQGTFKSWVTDLKTQQRK